jgi:hypothetical protein
MFTDFSEVFTAAIIRAMRNLRVSLIALMTEATITAETSVSIYHTTRRYNPEDSHLHIRHHEDRKSRLEYLSELNFPCFLTKGLIKPRL